MRWIPKFTGLIMGAYTLALASVAVVVALVDPTGRIYLWIARVLWGRPVLAMGGIKLVVRGGQNVDWKKPYVVCSNHASQMDIPALFGALPTPIRFLAKKSLFYIPILGWSMWLARFIPVDRGRGRKARAFIKKAAGRIRRGPSLMVFPEGTRTPDGTIKSFKSGAFVMAISAQVPVLPVAIRGSFQVMPKNTVRHNRGTIEVVIGQPIPTTNLVQADKEQLRGQTKRAISTMLEGREAP